MEGFLRWFASFKGIAVEDGQELRFEWASFPSGGLGLLVLLGIAAALLFVWAIYRRDAGRLSRGKRLILGVLRACSILLAIALLLEPSVVAVQRETRPGHTIVMVDLSQSMNHVDAFRNPEVGALADGYRALGVENPATTSRLDLARAILDHEDGRLLRELSNRNEVKLYGFAQGLESLPLVTPPALDGGAAEEGATNPSTPDQSRSTEGTRDLPPTPEIAWAEIEAKGRSTDLGSAVRGALEKSRGSEVAGVVLLSDGRRTAGPQGAEVARLLEQRKIPRSLVFGVGDPAETQLVELSRFETPDKVFQRDPFEVSGRIISTGYESVALSVRLSRQDGENAPIEVASQQVQIGGDDPEQTVTFPGLTSDVPGRFTYSLAIDPPSGEAARAERHLRTGEIEVLDEQTRVLMVVGCASPEYRFLQTALMRDKTIDLSCWLQSADEDFPQEGNTTIDQLPEDREALQEFDVFIFIDPDAAALDDSFCEDIAKQVEEAGAGLWWICGEKYTLDALRPVAPTAPLADLLPVVPDLQVAERTVYGFGYAFPRAWPYAVTPQGLDGTEGKITRIHENRDEARILWSRLPGFHVGFPVKRAKPAATILLEHTDPDLKLDTNRGMPLVATQYIGVGRVIWSGMDETYRWRSIFQEAYNRFWVKGIRWLFEGRLNAGNSRLRLELSSEKFELGESLQIRAEAKNPAFEPLLTDLIPIEIKRGVETVATVDLEPVAEAPGSYRGVYRPLEVGNYRIVSSGEVAVEAALQVVSASIEKEGPIDRAELAAIAGGTGGVHCETQGALFDALDQIPSKTTTDVFRTPHPMWDSWTTVALIVLLLSVEWLLRKRFNLL